MKRKLAVFGLAFSLAELAAAYLPSPAVWLAAVFALAGAVWAFRYRKARAAVLPLMAAVCLGLGCHLAYRALAVQPALALAGRTVQVTAAVQTDAETSYQEDRLRGTLHITELDGRPADLLVSCANFPGTQPGEVFSAVLALEELEDDSYRMDRYADGVYLAADYLEGYAYLGDSSAPAFWLYRLRRALSRRLTTWLPAEEGGVEAAMLIGDTARLSDTQQENFRVAGVSHLLAVSGLHVTLLCGLLAPAGDPRKRFFRPRIAGQAAVLLLYLALIGFPVSAVRAGFVYLVALGGYFFVQPPDTLTSMGLAALVLGVQNAYFVCDLGFQLSFSAVLGVQAASALARWERRRLPPQDSPLREAARRALLWLAETLQVTVLATLATMPVLLARGMTVSGVGVLTNLLVVWMLQPALVLGIGVLLFSVLPFLSFAMHGLSLVLALWLRAMCAVIGWCASLPGARLALPAAYTLFVLAVLGVLAAVFWRMRKFGWYLPAAAVCAALAIGLGVRMDRDVVRIAVVGTAGNPCLVVTQNGQAAALFRGGSSNLRAVQEYLDNAGGLPQTLLVDLRQDPRAMEFDAETVIPMDSLDSGLAAQTILDGVTLELVHDPGGNLAVLDINGYTVGIMAGRARLAQPLALNIYCAGASYPDSIDADTVIYTSRAADWLEEADAELLYGPEEPVVTIRPGRSATIDGVKEYAVQ